MTTTSSLPPQSTHTSITDAIQDAYDIPVSLERRTAARWVEKNGWRFRTDDFEDVLAGFVRLTDDDRLALREFRVRLISIRNEIDASLAVAA